MAAPTTFSDLPLGAPLQRALQEKNYSDLTPIQAEAIPLLLERSDLLGCAQTGTGKTAAFSLPILQTICANKRELRARTARVLVLTPTRELAAQVGESFRTYGRYLKLKHALAYGGVGYGPQINALRRGVDVLVACPGRLLDLLAEDHLTLDGVEFFVLDEADRMLDMGFVRDVRRIVDQLPKERQSLFFSATMPDAVVALSKSILNKPKRVTIAPEKTTAEEVTQEVCFVDRDDKRSLLRHFLKQRKDGELTIVFARMRYAADRIARSLSKEGIEALAIHGDRSQSQRERALNQFRNGKLSVLVATDVAARGVDVKGVTQVINFHLPAEAEAYVHRIGRTGRAGEAGRAISFCSPDEAEALRAIERLIKTSLPVNAQHDWHLASLAQDCSKGRQAASRKGKDKTTKKRGRPRRRSKKRHRGQ